MLALSVGEWVGIIGIALSVLSGLGMLAAILIRIGETKKTLADVVKEQAEMKKEVKDLTGGMQKLRERLAAKLPGFVS